VRLAEGPGDAVLSSWESPGGVQGEKTKQTSRGFAINEMMKRLRKPRAKTTWLVLAGHDDGDRKRLIAKGYKNKNIISCDIDRRAVARSRRNGGVAIQADVRDLLLYAEPNSFDAVMLDLCGGLTDRTMLVFHGLLGGSVCEEAPCYINCMRGRDHSGWGDSEQRLARLLDDEIPEYGGRKNRGFGAVLVLAVVWAMGIRRYTKEQMIPRLTEEYLLNVAWYFRPELVPPYKQNRVYMDGVVITKPTTGVYLRMPREANPALMRKLAALKAVRTRA